MNMNQKNIRSKHTSTTGSKGFTIIELLIATSIFAVVLIVALGGFYGIGQLFYKGVTASQTQVIAQDILNDISGKVQLAASVSPLQQGNGYNYFCAGGNRYTFIINQKVDLSATPDYSAGGNFGLVKDNLLGAGACAAPCTSSCPGGSVPINDASNPTELLGDNMRIDQLDIEIPYDSSGLFNPNLYNIKMVVVYGDDSALDYTVTSPTTDYSTVFCTGSSNQQQFCSVDRLNTNVYRGIHP
jgi:prepilin-type N-terminal cleavage/methylation domain-containing protein